MIVRPKVNWLRMLFVWNGSVLQSIIPQLLFMLMISLVALATSGRIFGGKMLLNTAPFTLMGVSLAIFLAFRNNASYDRYLEARNAWGRLLVAARSLTSQVMCYLPQDDVDVRFQRKVFVRRMIAVVYALKHQLRKTDSNADLARYLRPEELADIQSKHYKPVALINKLHETLGDLQRHQAISDHTLWLCNQQLNELSAVVGACERITNTPIPFVYGVLLHRTVYAYCILLPFGLVDTIGMLTPLISVFVAYTLIALEAIASEISEPFGTEPNNLALDALARTIERSILELNGQAMPDDTVARQRFQLT
jgi:putative membrane protein